LRLRVRVRALPPPAPDAAPVSAPGFCMPRAPAFVGRGWIARTCASEGKRARERERNREREGERERNLHLAGRGGGSGSGGCLGKRRLLKLGEAM
jgi:hypothetical protein